MSDSRKEFEENPVCKEKLDMCFFNGVYYQPNDLDNDDDLLASEFMDGAWFAFQEKQKTIDAFLKIVRDAYMSDGNSSVEIVYDKIQELLK